MGKKYFQIRMDEAHHRMVKTRAGQLNIPIGEYIENLNSSMELRLRRGYEIGMAQNLMGMLDDRFLRAILNGDKKGLSEQKLKAELIQIALDAGKEKDLAFVPTITV